MAVPDTEQEQDFIINQESGDRAQETEEKRPESGARKQKSGEASDTEFDLSDITATPKERSREEIIAEAEAAAFAEE